MKCLECGAEHEVWERHIYLDQPESVTVVFKGVPVTLTRNAMGRPRKYATAAERLAAYRKRKKEQG